MANRLLQFTVVLFFITSPVFCYESVVPVDSDSSSRQSDSVSWSPNVKPEVEALRCRDGEIVLDGILNEEVWQKCKPATNFVEIDPGDNIKASVDTRVLFAFDDDNLYVACICYDNDMSKLAANMSDRDNITSDDMIGIFLDTYGDYKQAYELFSNPLGIQFDAMRTATNENSSYDMVFETAAKIYKDKWIVEFQIPFKSLRFPERKIQKWGMHILRIRPRIENRTQMSWAVISRDNPSLLGQEGTLTGIRNVNRGKDLDILPYVIGYQDGYKSDANNPNSNFVNEKFKTDAGGGIKYGLTSNLSGELVYNPDFSQVESDAAQVSANTSTALYYAEKRPFFLEGGDFFNTNIQLVYTRMIEKPLFAAKLLGTVAGFDVGYIGAYDQQTQFIIPYDYGSNYLIFDTMHSCVNILRARKSLKGDSYLAMLYTDKEVSGGYNRTLDFDGSLNFLQNYYFNWQVIGYSTKEINDSTLYYDTTQVASGNHDLTFNGQKFNGVGGLLSFQQQERLWSYDLTYTDEPPAARRDLGFISSINYRQLSTNQNLTFYPQKGFFTKIFPSVYSDVKYEYNGSVKERVVMPNFFLQGKDQISLSGWFLLVNDEDFKDVTLKGVRRCSLSVTSNTSINVQGTATFELGKYIVRFTDVPFVGWGYNFYLTLNIRLIDRLLLENGYTYSELQSSYESDKLYAGYIFRNRTTFQFTKKLFLRLIVQYDSFQSILEIDPLLSYKWNPFTIFYIGSSSMVTDYGQGDFQRYQQSFREFFAKFQYLFRL